MPRASGETSNIAYILHIYFLRIYGSRLTSAKSLTIEYEESLLCQNTYD